MKKSLLYASIILTGIVIFSLTQSSCTKEKYDRYAYHPDEDTIAPELSISVPINNDYFDYGKNVAIVGTITDLESSVFNYTVNRWDEKSGELASLNIQVYDTLNPSILLMDKNLNVDGKSGSSFNEKFTIASSSATETVCRLVIKGSDKALPAHEVSKSVLFVFK